MGNDIEPPGFQDYPAVQRPNWKSIAIACVIGHVAGCMLASVLSHEVDMLYEVLIFSIYPGLYWAIAIEEEIAMVLLMLAAVAMMIGLSVWLSRNCPSAITVGAGFFIAILSFTGSVAYIGISGL